MKLLVAVLFVVGVVSAQYAAPGGGGGGGGGPAPGPGPAAPPAYVPFSASSTASAPAPSPPAAAGPTGPAAPAPAPTGPAAPVPSSPGGYSSSSSSSSSSGGPAPSGDSITVPCRTQKLPSGDYKFTCDSPPNPDDISLKSRHILWLPGPSGSKRTFDIDVPNYKVEELIQAGYKPGASSDQVINIKLKKPTQSYDAQLDNATPQELNPKVNLNYERVQESQYHIGGSGKPFSPVQGPLVPPPDGGGAGAGSGASAGPGPAPGGDQRYQRHTYIANRPVAQRLAQYQYYTN